jgi:lysophospholipase L1-like esterase
MTRLGRRAALALPATAFLQPRKGVAAPLAATPIGRMDLPWWRARHEEKLARLRAGPVRLIWLGDSITQNFERRGPTPETDYPPVWDRFYGDRDALNLGFSGDSTASVLWRLANGEVDGIAPAAVVLLIGANNLGHVHWGAEDTLAGIEAIMAELRRRLPGAKVVLLGVLPRAGDAWVIGTHDKINEGLAQRYGHAAGVTYIDASPQFMRGGRIDDDLYSDPHQSPPGGALHPNVAGMTRIATLIERPLSAYLGDRDKTAA